MKKTIFSLLLLAVCSLGATAQSADDLDAKYTQGLLKVGTQAPDFVLKKAKADQPALSLSSYSTHQEGTLLRPGCWVVLDFWATWCPDCRKDSPYIMSLYEKFAPKGVEFVGVSFDTKAESWKNGVEKLGIKYTQVSDMKNMRESAVAHTYAIKWIPTVYVIGPDGKVVLATVMSDKVGAYLTSVYPDCAE